MNVQLQESVRMIDEHGIATDLNQVRVCVVPTDKELMIARFLEALLN